MFDQLSLLQRIVLLLAAFLMAGCGTTETVPRGTTYYPGQPMPTQGTPGQMRPPAPPRISLRGTAPSIRAASYIMVDAQSGMVLSARGADVSRGVASTQKLLTALVVLDAGNLDKAVRIQSSDTRVSPTVIGLRTGETYTRRQLLYAMLVKSGNDAAATLARDVAGSIPAFASRMNAKARALGANSSYFVNPHGLTASGQHSTARDMVRIAGAAYRNPIIRDIVRRRSLPFRKGNGTTINLKSTNDLLGLMQECNGMKTGYTNAAGRCLISSAQSGSRAVILVQLGTKTKYIWDDGEAMMSWGLGR